MFRLATNAILYQTHLVGLELGEEPVPVPRMSLTCPSCWFFWIGVWWKEKRVDLTEYERVNLGRKC